MWVLDKSIVNENHLKNPRLVVRMQGDLSGKY